MKSIRLSVGRSAMLLLCHSGGKDWCQLEAEQNRMSTKTRWRPLSRDELLAAFFSAYSLWFDSCGELSVRRSLIMTRRYTAASWLHATTTTTERLVVKGWRWRRWWWIRPSTNKSSGNETFLLDNSNNNRLEFRHSAPSAICTHLKIIAFNCKNSHSGCPLTASKQPDSNPFPPLFF